MSILKDNLQNELSINEILVKYQDYPLTFKYKTFCLIDKSLDIPFTKLNKIKFDNFSNSTCFLHFDTQDLNDVFHLIGQHDVLDLNVIIINRSSKFVKKFHQALLLIDQKLNYSIINEAVCLDNTEYSLQHLIDADKKSFFNLAFLGQQSHLTDYNCLDQIQDCNVIQHRLAEIKANSPAYLSTLRNTNAASLFLSVLKSSELLDSSGEISSSGLSVEELAQISYHLGNSSKCKLINIQLGDIIDTTSHKELEIAFQILWYHLDGIDKIVESLPDDLHGFQEYSVEECLGNVNLRFLKSNISGKWWMEIPFELKDEFKKHQYYACSYQDYLAASQGDLPDELIEAIERFEIARIE